MENGGYSINEVGNFGGNDKVKTKFILFYLFIQKSKNICENKNLIFMIVVKLFSTCYN